MRSALDTPKKKRLQCELQALLIFLMAIFDGYVFDSVLGPYSLGQGIKILQK